MSVNSTQRTLAVRRHRPSRGGARQPLRSFVRESETVDPLAWFVSGWRQQGDAFLWWRPRERFALAGVGRVAALPAGGDLASGRVEAWWLSVTAGIHRDGAASEAATGPLMWCGSAFDPADDRLAADPVWAGFPTAAAVLPRALLTRRGDGCWLTLNGRSDEGPPEGLPDAHVLEGAGPAVRSVRDDPDTEVYKQQVRAVTAAIAAGRVDKVVLARSKRVVGAAAFSPADILRRLGEQNPESTIFAVGCGEACFLGATPERLVSVRDGLATSMSLAGSRPRGAQAGDDARLAGDLLASGKDRHEHALVVAEVARALRTACTGVHADEVPRVLRLGSVQHLYSEVSGTVASDHPLLRLVHHLHPTPAVGGLPRDAATEMIRRLEPRARGWYAGPLGWVDAGGDGEFAVGIRSGVIRGSEALVYAGCGIVAGSEPEAEVHEAEAKFAPLLEALGAPAS